MSSRTATAAPPEPVDAPPPAPIRRLSRAAPVAGAAASGGLLLFAFPPYDLWWLAPVAVALLALAVQGRRARTGAALGALAGAVFFAPLLRWTNLEIGNVPWLLLAGAESAYLALMGAAAAYTGRIVTRWWWSWPLLTAVLWVGQEALRTRFPFGGFPWGRLAFSQGDSPLLALAAWGGAPLVTAAVAAAGGLLAVLAAHGWRALTRRYAVAPATRLPRVGGRAAAAATAALLALVAIAAAAPTGRATGEPVTVAIVQGNVPTLGLDFNQRRRAVLDYHAATTEELARQVAAGRLPRPDLVIWPENSSDIDPIANPDAAARISAAADAVGVPILVGAIVRDAQGPRNVGLVWHPGSGPGEQYVKRHPVPFAEYLPLKSVVYPIARAITEVVDRVVGFVPGDRPGVLTMGPARVGTVICFEVGYDGLVRDTVTAGGRMLVVQTNNATFDEAEARQQLAMVRLRAVEHGQWALMASTVGISGFVSPDGTIHDETGFFTQEVRVRTLTLADDGTVATAVGAWPEAAMVGLALVALVVAAGGRGGGVAARHHRARGRTGPLRPQKRGGEMTDAGMNSKVGGRYDLGRVLVVIPTYNEVENLRPITARVCAAVPEAEILVVDDASPDGTGELADRLAAEDPRIHVLHRPGKQGLGAAYVAGFRWALERGYDVVVEMDADGSHAPEELPTLLAALGDADVVLGSRWVPGGRVVNWPRRRMLLSRGGNLYTRLLLGMPVRDATGGYRAYRAPVLDKIDIDSVASQGYCFQVDLAWRAHQQRLRLVEVPITFTERQRGRSKMSSAIVREALWRVTVWGLKARLAALRRSAPAS